MSRTIRSCQRTPPLILNNYEKFVLKVGSMSPPNHYVDANIDKVQNANGSIMWETHSAENFKAAIVNI